jgi:hypothetical protein
VLEEQQQVVVLVRLPRRAQALLEREGIAVLDQAQVAHE